MRLNPRKTAVAIRAAIPGLALVAGGIALTAWLISGWGLGHALRRDAVAIAPYLCLPIMIGGAYLAIERASAVFKTRDPE